jgi:DNA-binding transcriptional LysR family regulator
MTNRRATGIKLDVMADLHKWRAFVAIAELGSLTRAALFLDRAQPVLSRQMNALERECDVRLFVRTGRGVELSEIGKQLFPEIKALLTNAGELEREIRGKTRAPSGVVTLGLLPSLGNPLIGRLFKRMHELHPAIHLKILEGSSGQVEEWLGEGRLDIAILYRYTPSVPEGEHSLATVDSYLIGAKGDRLSSAAEVAFATLDRLPLILPSAPNGLRNALDALARRERITIDPVIEADSLQLFKSVVAEEHLYTVLPLHAVWFEVQGGHLQAAKIVNPPLQRDVSMVLAASKGPRKAVSETATQIVRIVDEMAKKGLWWRGTPT